MLMPPRCHACCLLPRRRFAAAADATPRRQPLRRRRRHAAMLPPMEPRLRRPLIADFAITATHRFSPLIRLPRRHAAFSAA